jgi:RNA-directed DNA polymerase
VNADRLTTPQEKVRELQEKLGHAAKMSRRRRFHALYDKVYRLDVLQEAWRRIRSNKGAAGIDKQTLQDIEDMGVQRFLLSCQQTLKEGTYHPKPVR